LFPPRIFVIIHTGMTILAENRKAFHEMEVLEKHTAGISLFGYEVKAIKEGKADFEGSFVKVVDGKPEIFNLFIGSYSKRGEAVHGDPRRARWLLLKDYEIKRLAAESSQKGFSIVPLKFILDHGLIKLEIALARGKKKFEKKADLKEKQEEVDLRRAANEAIP